MFSTKKLSKIALALVTMVLFQNCTFTDQEFASVAPSEPQLFANKEDQIFSLLQEAYELATLLRTYDFRKMVLKNDASLDADAENRKTEVLAGDLKAKADLISDMLLVEKVAVNSSRVSMEVDQLLNLLSKGRDQKVSHELMARDMVLQSRVDDLQAQVNDQFGILNAAIGRVRDDLAGFKKMVDDRFVLVEASISDLKNGFDAFKVQVDRFMSEQGQTNAALAKAIEDAKASLGEQIAKEELARRELGVQLSNEFAAALAAAKAELNANIDDKFRQSMLQARELEDKMELMEASLSAAITAGDANLAKQIQASQAALQLEMNQKIGALRDEMNQKITSTNDALNVLRGNLEAVDFRLNAKIDALDAVLRTELLRQKDELAKRIAENEDKAAALALALQELTAKGEITDALLTQIRNEMLLAAEQERQLADLQNRICKEPGQTNCIRIEDINCDAMFTPGTASNTQCKTIVQVLINHDQQLRALAAMTSSHAAAIDNLTKAFQTMNERVVVLENSMSSLSSTVANLASNVAEIDAKFESKIAVLNSLVASTNQKVIEILPRLTAVEGGVAELRVAVQNMGDLSDAARAEMLAAIDEVKSGLEASIDRKMGPLNAEIARINAKLEGMAIDIAVLKFNKERGEIMSALKARVAFNAAWITRRSADVRSQFCVKRTNAALTAFDYEAAKQNWVFCHEKLTVLNRASEFNSIALGYIESLGAIDIDATCSAQVRDLSGVLVRADLLTVKDLMNDAILKDLQAKCGSKGRPAAVALMVNIMKFLRLIGPDHRTYEYLGSISQAASAILLGAPYRDVSESQLKAFRDIDPTSADLAGTPYGKIERLFANRYIESTFRVGGKANGAFPESPTEIRQPASLGATHAFSAINTGNYVDPSFGTAYGARLKALEITSSEVGFKVVARNHTSPSPGVRYRFPRDVKTDACPVDDHVLVRHDAKWYGYHVRYHHVNELFEPVLFDGLHRAIANDQAATDDSQFSARGQIIVDRAGLTLAKIPRRIVLRATRPYANAYARPSCVKFTLVHSLRKDEWKYGAGATASEVQQRNELHRYLTGFSESMIQNTCKMQTYERTKWVKTSGAPKYKTVCQDIAGATVDCASSAVANRISVQDGFESDVLRLIGETDSAGNVIQYQVGDMKSRDLLVSNSELRSSFSATGAATLAAQKMISPASTQLAEGYWMYKDAAIAYTGVKVNFSSSAPFARSHDKQSLGLSSSSFVREGDKTGPIQVHECEHCPGNTKILGPCNKTVNTPETAQKI